MDKGYCGVIVFFYKNIIQNSNTACIPELLLAFLSLITNSTSTAYEGHQVNRTKTQIQTIDSTLNFMLHNYTYQQVNILILGTLSVRQNQTLTTNMKQRLGFWTLISHW